MDIEAIAAALGRIDPTPVPSEVPKASATLPPKTARLLADLQQTKALEQVLAADSRFAQGGGYMISHGSGAYSLDAPGAALILLRRYKRTGDAMDASRWLMEAMERNEMGYRATLALYGVALTHPVPLTESLEIVPFAMLPPTSMKEILTPDHALQERRPFSYESVAPTAALVARGRLKPFIRVGDGMASMGAEVLLREAALALTVAGPCSPLEAGAWYELDDPDLMSYGSGMSRQHVEVTPMFRHRDRPLDTENAPIVVQKFLQSNGTTRDRLTIAIARLNQAMRRADSSPDKALDLAIALEALVSGGFGGNAHRVSLRAALLHPGPDDERIEVRGMVNALFNLRNEVAHQGRLPHSVSVKAPRRELKAAVLLKKVEPIIAAVIRAVLERTKVPTDDEWYAMEVTRGRS